MNLHAIFIFPSSYLHIFLLFFNIIKSIYTKGGIMKRVVIAAVALLLGLSVSAFAIEGSQPPKETAPNFEQMKADHLKKLEERMSSLQEEKACVQAANNQDGLKACRAKHKAEMREHRDDMRMRGGPGGPGSQVPPQVK